MCSIATWAERVGLNAQCGALAEPNQVCACNMRAGMGDQAHAQKKGVASLAREELT